MIPIPFIGAQWELTEIFITGVFLYIVCRLNNVNILKQDLMTTLSFIEIPRMDNTVCVVVQLCH